MHRYWDSGGIGGWGYVVMILTMLVVVALMTVVVISLTRKGNDSSRDRASAAEQLLAERFARGEIDEEEYRRRLAVLRGSAPPGKGG